MKVHLASALFALLLTTAGLVWYALACIEAGRLLGGGSAAGLACGIAAGLVIVFEMLLWPRKAFRRLRLVATKHWMAAHIWLGIASLPLALVHSGFHLGGLLPATFMVLFVLTILSGLYGLAVQNILPKWMLRNLPAETIASQIDYVSARVVDDARALLLAACGRRRRSAEEAMDQPDLVAAAPQSIVVGAVRQSGRTRGRTLETRQVIQAREDAEPLWNALDEIEPFLLHGGEAASPVSDRQQARPWFARLRSACSVESGFVIDSLEQFCDQRRQFDIQARAHRWLHAWLPLHIGLSVAVTVLLAAHAWTALRYW